MSNPYHDPQYAKQYDNRWQLYNYHARRLTEELLTFLPKLPYNILEIGCGTGNILALLQKHYPHAHLHGIDQATAMVEVATQKLLEATIETGTIETTKPSQCYDLIISASMFHYIENPAVWLKKVSQHLTPSGYLLLVDWNRNTPLMKLRSAYLSALPYVAHVYSETEVQKSLNQWNTASLQRRAWCAGWWSLQGWLVTKATDRV